jgi:hypothetical protein
MMRGRLYEDDPLSTFMAVPEVGLEPTRAVTHWILRPPCSRTGTDSQVQERQNRTSIGG